MEPTVKLNNFVAANIHKSKTDAASKFSNHKQNRDPSERASSNEEEDYEEDFESLSKSQVALSMNKIKQRLQATDSYSNDQFESVDHSKSASAEHIVCFVCKQQIPKAQALSHH